MYIITVVSEHSSYDQTRHTGTSSRRVSLGTYKKGYWRFTPDPVSQCWGCYTCYASNSEQYPHKAQSR